MNDDYVLLSGDEAMKIIHLCVNGCLDFYIFDTQKDKYYKLTRGDAEKIRKKLPNKTEITTSPAQFSKIRSGAIKQFAHDEPVGITDLWLRKEKYNDIFPKSAVEDKKSPEKPNMWPKNGKIAEMNADRALAIMAILLSKSKSLYRTNNRPNHSQISKEVSKLAKLYFGEDKSLFEAFYKRLSKALKLLSIEPSTKNKK